MQKNLAVMQHRALILLLRRNAWNAGQIGKPRVEFRLAQPVARSGGPISSDQLIHIRREIALADNRASGGSSSAHPAPGMNGMELVNAPTFARAVGLEQFRADAEIRLAGQRLIKAERPRVELRAGHQPFDGFGNQTAKRAGRAGNLRRFQPDAVVEKKSAERTRPRAAQPAAAPRFSREPHFRPQQRTPILRRRAPAANPRFADRSAGRNSNRRSYETR